MSRSYWQDNLRILAMFFVVTIHVFHEPPIDSAMTLYKPIRSRLSVCVPIFVLISGSLVIKPSNDFARITGKVLHLISLLLVWGLIYVLYSHTIHRSYTISGVIGVFIFSETPGAVHLWFLYCIVGLYLFTPMIGCVYPFCSQQKKTIFSLIMVCMLFETKLVPSFFPLSDPMVRVSSTPPWLTTWINYLPYFILGKVLCDRKGDLRSYRYGLVCVLITFACWVVYTESVSYLTLPIFGLSLAIFAASKEYWKKPFLGAKYTVIVSNCMFGVYLVHLIVRNIVRDIGLIEVLLLSVVNAGPFVYILVQIAIAFFVFSVSLLLVAFLRLTPARVLLT